MSKRYIIIGDGAAGTTAAQYVRQYDADGDIEIYSDDPNPAYFRAALTNYLIGELREDQIWAVPPTFYHQFRVKRMLARVAEVVPERAQIRLSRTPTPVSYDHLLIAAGSRARPAPFEGGTLPGVLTMRTLQDVRRVMDLVKVHGLREAVVVGGGPLAMEWVQGLHEREVKVTYLLRGDHLMSRVLDKTASDLTLARMRLAGIDVRTNEEVIAAMPGTDGQVTAVRTKSGDTISCQLVGVAIGVICNSEFLKESGIELNKQGGIVVDEHMQTNKANIYAAGDIASVDGQLLQLWEPAKLQGRVAATNMTGGEATYHMGAHYNATRLYDLDFASVGQVQWQNGDEEIVDFPQGQGRIAYRKIVLRDGRLRGAIMVGQRQEKVRARGRLFKKLIDANQDIDPVKYQLLDPAFDLRAWLDTRSITSKPKVVARPQMAPPPAQMRRTQMLKPAKRGQQMVAAAALARPQALLANADTGQDIELGEYARVGRTPDNTLILDDIYVSSRHAEIRWQEDAYYLTDLGSSNGTFINDERLSGTRVLNDGDVVRFGQTPFRLTLTKVAVPAAQPVSPTPAAKATITAPVPSAGNFLASIGLGTQQLAKPVLTADGQQVASLQGDGQSWTLDKTTITIGRDAENDVVLDDEGVSHAHAHIVRDGNQLYLRDLGSRNGTWANEEQVTLPYLLRDGDRLHMGHTQLVFRDPNAPQRRRPRRPQPTEDSSDQVTFTLTIRSGSAIGLSFDLSSQGVVKVGRDEDSDVWINDPSVSFNHAVIRRKGEGWVVTDAQSTNGTYVNQERVAANGEALIKHGDELYLGQVAAIVHTSHCPHCQAAVKPQTQFCTQCGQAVAAAAPAAKRAAVTCPNCKATVKVGQKFCNQCGNQLGT